MTADVAKPGPLRGGQHNVNVHKHLDAPHGWQQDISGINETSGTVPD